MKVKVNVSNRHVHLSEKDLFKLFGDGYKLGKKKDLIQPGEFASLEKVTIKTKKGKIDRVRIIGPTRGKTQVEVSNSDALVLGIKPPLRDSGDLDKSETVTIEGPEGSIVAKNSTIIARRHIHMTDVEASEYGLANNDMVSVCFEGERGGILSNVRVKSNENYALEMHIDTDEAKAMFVNNGDIAEVIKMED